jgi:hypothetical protein
LGNIGICARAGGVRGRGALGVRGQGGGVKGLGGRGYALGFRFRVRGQGS